MSTRAVAVIGAGFGGLTAAAWLARAGNAVTLFEVDSVPGGKAQTWSQDGLTLDTGPTLLTLPGTVRDLFERIGAPDLLPPLIELPLQCSYRWPDGRTFQVARATADTEASAEALQRGEGTSVQRFYAEAAAIHRAAGEPYLEAPYEGMPGFLARVLRRGVGAAVRGLRLSTLDGLARKCFRSPALQQFVGRFATYAGASPYRASAAFALIAHLERTEGVHHVQGGVGALARALAGAAARQGVALVFGARAQWAREGAGFRVGPRGDERRFDALVINADPSVVMERRDEARALSGYVLLLRVDGDAPLPHHTVLFSGDARAEFAALFSGQLPSDPTLHVCSPSATDPTMAPPGKAGLYVMACAPPLAPEQGFAEEAAKLRAHCLARLTSTWPALRGRLTVLAERTPEDFRRQGAPGGSLYGFLPHGRLGPFRRPRIRGPLPGLFFAGGGTHPGGGVPLAMLSGRFAAELAHAELSAGRRAS